MCLILINRDLFYLTELSESISKESAAEIVANLCASWQVKSLGVHCYFTFLKTCDYSIFILLLHACVVVLL